MKENEIALTLIHRIGINNFKDKDFVESIKRCIFHPELKPTNTTNVSSNSNFEPEPENYSNSENKPLKKEKSRSKAYNLKDEVPIQVQLLEHLVYLRNESSSSKYDSSLKENIKSRSLLIFVKNLLTEFKRSSSWNSILDDVHENDTEYLFEGIDKLFGLLLISSRLEKYLRSESTITTILASNVLLSFRYIFQSESSNLSVVQHPEWAIEYLRECVKKYMLVFKKVKNDIKIDCTSYFKALIPEPYSENYGLLEEFSLICGESGVDDIVSSWCLLIAREARLFVYSRLPFLVYDYFMENEEKNISLTELIRLITNPNNSTVLEVSRSSFSDEKVTSVIYSLIASLVDLSVYLRSFDHVSAYDLFSDFDNNTTVPFIMIQFYDYNKSMDSFGSSSMESDNGDYNFDVTASNSKTSSDNNTNLSHEHGNNSPATETNADNLQFKHINRGSNNLRTNDGEPHLESKILLCFESNVLYGCLDALLEMENTHSMEISKRLVTLESFSESIGVSTGLNTSLYLQDDQFISQVSNILISVLKLVERRCQCLRLMESKRKYVLNVVVPLIEHFMDSVKHIWNSLENVLDSCTISCLLLESATVLHEFLLKFSLSEFMQDSLRSLDNITNKMVGIINQYFVELYYEPFKNIHRHPLEIMSHITHKLLEMCALTLNKNYNKILNTTLCDMEKVLISTLIPNKSSDFILMEEEDVEVALNNCEYVLESVRKLVDPGEQEETMQQIQDVTVILRMGTVELKTSAEYLNLLGTGRIASKNNMEETNQESQPISTNKMNKADYLVSSFMFEDSEADCTDDIHDSLIVSKIKQKLKIKKLTLSQTYTLIKHILYATASEDYPLDEGDQVFN